MLPTIIVPVFNAFEFLVPCLDSLERTIPADTSIVFVDDASTDIRIKPLLQAWVKKSGRYRNLITNRQNKGFVAAANIGMRWANSDVVLLNSDTVVTEGWLQRLADCMASDASIATATPWSNNGEIVSIPGFCLANVPPVEPDVFATVIASCGKPTYPNMPTAVGFCMAISLHAIKQVGLFDEATFGRGYGEENDFCQRAEKAGLRNVLCDDAYVVHHGGASFAPLGLKPGEESMQRLLGRHPDYRQKVAEFIAADPLATRRQEILDCLERSSVRMS